jgi:hypothetical protein
LSRHCGVSIALFVVIAISSLFSLSPLPPNVRFEVMQFFDGNKDKKLTWLALLFGDNKGLTGGGKADSTDDACHRKKELFSELYYSVPQLFVIFNVQTVQQLFVFFNTKS